MARFYRLVRLVLDLFYVRDLKGEAISEDDARWSRLISDLRELLADKPDPAAVASLIAKRRPLVATERRVPSCGTSPEIRRIRRPTAIERRTMRASRHRRRRKIRRTLSQSRRRSGR